LENYRAPAEVGKDSLPSLLSFLLIKEFDEMMTRGKELKEADPTSNFIKTKRIFWGINLNLAFPRGHNKKNASSISLAFM